MSYHTYMSELGKRAHAEGSDAHSAVMSYHPDIWVPVDTAGGASDEITYPGNEPLTDTGSPAYIQVSERDKPPAPHTNGYTQLLAADEHGRPLPQADQDALAGYYANAEHTLLNEFSAHTEGLDLQRVGNFMASLGLRDMPILDVAEGDGPQLAHTISALFDSAPANATYRGVWLDGIATGFIIRDTKLEQYNGTSYTDSIRVHEKAHGTATNVRITARLADGIPRLASAQAGFYSYQKNETDGTKKEEGVFLEEGFAEWVRGLYITEELGLTTGFIQPSEGSRVPETERKRVIRHSETGLTADVSMRYFRYFTDGGPGVDFKAYGGEALQRLVAYDPGMRGALLASRSSNEAYRELIGRMDAIEPGLYQRLRGTPFNSRASHESLCYVSALTGK